MDPNRNKIEIIVQLPTRRLLSIYKKERQDFRDGFDSQENERRLTLMKEELDRREHVQRGSTK